METFPVFKQGAKATRLNSGNRQLEPISDSLGSAGLTAAAIAFQTIRDGEPQKKDSNAE